MNWRSVKDGRSPRMKPVGLRYSVNLTRKCHQLELRSRLAIEPSRKSKHPAFDFRRPIEDCLQPGRNVKDSKVGLSFRHITKPNNARLIKLNSAILIEC